MVGIERTAETGGAGAGDPCALRLAEIHHAVGLGWENGRAAQRGVVKAAGGKGDVAHEFGVEAETGLTGEQFVERVREFEVGAGERRLAVGGREGRSRKKKLT